MARGDVGPGVLHEGESWWEDPEAALYMCCVLRFRDGKPIKRVLALEESGGCRRTMPDGRGGIMGRAN